MGKSALTLKGFTFCVTAFTGMVTGYADRSSCTFTVFVVGTAVGLAVYIDRFTATAGISRIFCRTFILAAEAFTGSIICVTGICAVHVNGTSGAAGIPVVAATVCRTF